MEERYVEGDDVVLVTLCSEERPFCCGASVKEVISWFQDKLRTVPEEYRDAVQCEFDGVPDYDGAVSWELRVFYYRPAIDADRAAWKQRQEQRRLKEIAYARNILAQYGEQVP